MAASEAQKHEAADQVPGRVLQRVKRDGTFDALRVQVEQQLLDSESGKQVQGKIRDLLKRSGVLQAANASARKKAKLTNVVRQEVQRAVSRDLQRCLEDIVTADGSVVAQQLRQVVREHVAKLRANVEASGALGMDEDLDAPVDAAAAAAPAAPAAANGGGGEGGGGGARVPGEQPGADDVPDTAVRTSTGLSDSDSDDDDDGVASSAPAAGSTAPAASGRTSGDDKDDNDDGNDVAVTALRASTGLSDSSSDDEDEPAAKRQRHV